MKKCIISAIAGALGMLLLLYGIAAVKVSQEEKEYEHIDFVSELPQEDCFLCGSGSDLIVSSHWGEDNVGIINLNTFELLHLEINRYDDDGKLIEEEAGFMQASHLIGDDTYAHAWVHPDSGYADVQISNVAYAIDADVIQNHLCQTCLDTINDIYFSDNPPAEYAIISFEERTIRPLIECYTWFSAGEYGINCEFKENGDIDLIIHYCASRYK